MPGSHIQLQSGMIMILITRGKTYRFIMGTLIRLKNPHFIMTTIMIQMILIIKSGILIGTMTTIMVDGILGTQTGIQIGNATVEKSVC